MESKKTKLKKTKKTSMPKIEKITTKTPVNKQTKILQDAPETQYFIFCDGHPIKNVTQLAEKLEQIEDHLFNYHVTEDKNDFVNWIKDIFEEVELAQEIAGLKNKDHVRLAIYKHIVKKTSKKK